MRLGEGLLLAIADKKECRRRETDGRREKWEGGTKL